ncbi:hypothetical protein ACWEFL_03870 [Streptomyces sp. NPDC004838]
MTEPGPAPGTGPPAGPDTRCGDPDPATDPATDPAASDRSGVAVRPGSTEVFRVSAVRTEDRPHLEREPRRWN